MKEFTLIELIISVAMLLILVGSVVILPFVKLSSRGQGNHTGVVTAIDQVGWFFPNYEVYFKTDASSSQEDVYCVHRDNRALADQLREANKNKAKVTITYRGVRGIGLGLCGEEQIEKVEVSQ